MTTPAPRARGTILVADDDAITRRLLQVALQKAGWPVELASSGTDALAALEREGGPRLAVLDLEMPGLDGDEVCRRVRASGRARPYAYLLLLTASAGGHARIAGLDSGADDFLGKPFDPAELQARLRAGERVLAAHDDLLREQARLRQRATSDALTGLPNRAAILAALDAELARRARAPAPLAIAIAGLDRLGELNDRHGREKGDAALHVLAGRMRASLREYDLLGRLDGDEFLAVLPGCGRDAAAVVGARLRASAASASLDSGPATLSVGVALAQGEAAPELLARAAAALARAKAAGRDRIELSVSAGPAGA